jgi:hypothetical protein
VSNMIIVAKTGVFLFVRRLGRRVKLSCVHLFGLRTRIWVYVQWSNKNMTVCSCVVDVPDRSTKQLQ